MKPAPAPNIDQATRHVVYRDMMAFLPIASSEQTDRFFANLSVSKCIADLTTKGSRQRRKVIDMIRLRFSDLRVTPDIAESSFRGFPPAELTAYLVNRYGERLAVVPGFYQTTAGWSINLPKRCVMHAYRAGTGHIAGVLCQPIDRIDSYFLLSSLQQGGPRAERLSPRDKAFFEQFRQPMPIGTAREILKLAA